MTIDKYHNSHSITKIKKIYLSNVIVALKKHIDKNFPFLVKAKAIIAVSGGVDSVVLTHALHQLGYSIALAHVNFKLRGEASDLDQEFVVRLGQELQIPVFIHTADTNAYAKKRKVSIQMAAREIRYQWFETLLKDETYEYVLTAHHEDDLIETFFINLNRGSGLEGLLGIPKRNASVIRPLLGFDRAAILAFANQHKLKWREDRSNASTKYLRNKIRHQLIPVLKEINPDYKKAIRTSQAHLTQSKALVDDYIASLIPTLLIEKKQGFQIILEKLEQLPNPDAVLYELLHRYGFTQWSDIYQLPNAQTGKMLYSKTHFLLKDRAFLTLGVLDMQNRGVEKQEISNSFSVNNIRYSINTHSKPDVTISKNPEEACIDLSKIVFPLFVRKWEKGDYFYPLGMQGKKKLSDFLIDQKIARDKKEKIYLLCDAKDQVIWVIGKRLDDRFKITKTTKEILKITPQHEENT